MSVLAIMTTSPSTSKRISFHIMCSSCLGAAHLERNLRPHTFPERAPQSEPQLLAYVLHPAIIGVNLAADPAKRFVAADLDKPTQQLVDDEDRIRDPRHRPEGLARCERC